MVFMGHDVITPRRRRRADCHAIVLREAVSRSTFGSNPSSSRARVMSGTRRVTSSYFPNDSYGI